MNQTLGILTILSIIFYFQNCANPGVVTGGPKDTIPPQLISSYPVDQTLNFDNNTIILEFNEPIAAEKIKQSLIITPTTSTKFKHFIKKNKITIEFEEPFQDTTTYTLNFFDAITDITEKNPPLNLVLAFSTGDYIDSLRLYGKVKELFSDKPQKKATVALYPNTDSTDIFKDIPTYFSTTDNYGIFSINNIKHGSYKIITFDDQNKNLLFDEANEAYAFHEGFINPAQISDSLRFYTYQIDASELKVNVARISGRYYEMKYAKPIIDYRILETDSILTINSNILDDKQTIRFYNPFNGYPNDSIMVILEVRDSLKNYSTDTTYIAFSESSRKKSDFTLQALPASGKTIDNKQNIQIKFSKPVKSWDLTNTYVRLDSIHSIPINNIKITWNHNYTEAYLNSLINQKQVIDSVDIWSKRIVIDSLNPDTLQLKKKMLLERYDPNSINVIIEPYSFISIENDSSTIVDLKYKFTNTEELGTLTVNISADTTKYVVQLIGKGGVVQEKYSCESCYFKDIIPGKYSIRLLIDSNMDSTWTIGNIRKDLPPEPIHHFPEETEIRSNFDMELDISL